MDYLCHTVQAHTSSVTVDKFRDSVQPFPDVGKEFAYNAGDPGLNAGSGRSSGEGNGNPFQYSCLENPTDRGAWRVTAHGVAKSWTQLSD